MKEQAWQEIGKDIENTALSMNWTSLIIITEFQKNIYFCFIDYAKAFDCVDHNKLENSERDGNTRPPNLSLEKPVCRSESNS